ncbi:Uu.00g079120.m01.CDS01 [Anthostomella pinea]|uniref:Uu.00g079120.m01.CDS01 n=1 Tax=Anthostomella pinea TaxID=933095 RepID=A0AAI8VKQ8_9PEZI|nr:Uu.00g079120.m01.CDS01 [Anthostomella pinea]
MAANQQQMKKGNAGPSAQAQDRMADEEQLEQALKHLDLLYIKCRELRTTIPRMFESVPDTTENLVDVYSQAIMSMKSASTEIKDFGALYTNEQSKKVLEQAKKSRDANPKGIRPWRARDHPNLMDSSQ